MYFSILCSSQLFLYINCHLRHLIASQSSVKGVFNLMWRPKIISPGVACNIVWYTLCNSKSVAAIIPAQGSSSSRRLFFKSNVCRRFTMTWCIRSSFGFSFEVLRWSHNIFLLSHFWTNELGIIFHGRT